MGRFFSIAELTYSHTARERGIDNTPPPTVKVCLEILIGRFLDPLREAWGKPIRVNSGFRSPVLNKAVGGVPNSQHVAGRAVDITAGSSGENEKLFRFIRQSGLEFDQLISEKGYTWLHVSYHAGHNRNQVLYR